MKKILFFVSILVAWGMLSYFAVACPSVCLGEHLGAVDWNNQDRKSVVLIQSVARQSNLDQVDFSQADLTGINLARASLNGANLTGAQLIGADMRETTLSGAVFVNTNLSGAVLAHADMTGVALTTSDLSAVNFSEARLVNSNLNGMNLAGAYMDEAQMAGIQLEHAYLPGAQISKSDLSGANLRYADLRGVWINLTILVSADLRGANLAGASMIGSDLTGAYLNEAVLVGANLVGANLRGADLRGADLRQTILVATPELVAREKMIDPELRAMSESQWKELALGDTVLEGARYDDQTRFPQGFTPPTSMIYLPASQETSTKTGAAPGMHPPIQVAGSGNVAMVFQPLARAFSAQNPLNAFNLTVSDSTDGIAQLGAGQVEIALSSRPPTASETASIAGLRAFPIAKDSLVAVVNWNNSVTRLTTDQLRAIYSGEVYNWQALGGPDLEITPLKQENTLIEVFRQQVMANQPFTDRVVTLPSNAAVRAEIAARPGAVGLIPAYLIDTSIHTLELNGVAYSPTSVQSGQYPLIRPFYLLVRGTPDANLLKFLEMIASGEGKEIIKKEGLEP